jgi:hypothetical protein
MNKPRWKRILMWCGIVVGIAVAYALLFGVQTFVVYEARSWAKEYPVVLKTPAELPDVSISTVPGRKLSYLGCEFEVPWNDLDEEKTKLVGKWQFIAFHSGHRIVLSKTPPKERVSIFLTPLMARGKPDEEGSRNAEQVFGEETLRSDYAYTRAMLETTPANFSVFMSRRESLRAFLLLMMKPTWNLKTGIFLIQSKDFRGFQYGNPRSQPPEIIDELFSDNANLKFTFIEIGKGRAINISQAEINRIIQTARCE